VTVRPSRGPPTRRSEGVRHVSPAGSGRMLWPGWSLSDAAGATARYGLVERAVTITGVIAAGGRIVDVRLPP
jgi:hypothetical protein